MKDLDVIFIDVYLGGKFQCQLRYFYKPEVKDGKVNVEMPDLRKYVEMKKPELKGTDFRTKFSLQGL